jgi:hypothetical protein
MPLCLVHSGGGIFGIVLAISISQIEMVSIIKTIANRPMMVGHSLHQIVLSFQFLE